MLAPWFERAPGIGNDGFGITASHSSSHGLTVELGLGYMPYHFKGAFTDQSAQLEDTEYATSKLALVHVTASVLWPIQLHRMLSLEIGLGLDLGVITGDLRRSEAYADAHGSFQPCHGAGNPMTTGPDTDASGTAIPYCDQAFDSHGNPIATSPAKVSAAHYGVNESRVPPVMLIPMLPHLAFRFAPIERIAIKLEAAFSIAQFWVGASVQVGLGRARAQAPAPETIAAIQPTPARSLGRILGKLMEYGTNAPIARAAVKTKRVFSALQTDDSGLFVFDKLDPGPVHLELSHPAYEAGSCDATIPAQGGDAVVHCFLRPQRTEGAISGQVKDEQGLGLAGARVEVAGPVSSRTISDRDGLFAVPDLPEGSYRLRIEADSFLVQEVEIEVRSRETATPQITLLKAPTP
jgi:hypothetical protein